MNKGLTFRLIVVTLSVVLGAAYLAPTLDPQGKRLPAWFTKYFSKRIQLGLDLQGGTHLVYEVQVDKAVSDKTDRLEADIAEKLREEAKVTGLKTWREERDDIVLQFPSAADMDKLDRKFLRDYATNLTEAERDEDKRTVRLRLDGEYVREVQQYAVSQAVETLRNRVDQFGVREPDIRQRGNDVSVDLPGVEAGSAERLKERIAQTAQLEFKIVDDDGDYMEKVAAQVPKDSAIKVDVDPYDGIQRGTVQDVFLRARSRDALEKFFASLPDELKVPADHQILFEETQARDDKGNDLPEKEWRTYYLLRRADLTGEYISDAQTDWDQQTGRPEVALTFDRNGATIFEKLSGENVGKRMAIVLDEVVKSAPVLQSRIGGGRARITLGGYRDPLAMQQEASDLAAVLRAGALPAPLRKVFETRVGPTLGRDAIEQGRKAFVVGLAVVGVFMAYYYRLMGLFAVLAVAINVLWVLAIMAALEASLTLPGIAGLLLTAGMAVDANVIINERIREELRAGKSIRSALATGYDRAFWAIFDSQLTTAIAGVVLLQYGSGPLRGFAVTLLIGITCSVVTGVWVTRTFADTLVERFRVQRLSV